MILSLEKIDRLDEVRAMDKLNLTPRKFSNEEKLYLETKWREGVQTCGHNDVPDIAQHLHRPVKMIKNWISNHRQKIEGRITKRVNKPKSYRHLSCMNVFVQERCQGIPMSEWPKKWKEQTADSQKQYKDKAIEKSNQISSSLPKVKLEKELNRLAKVMEANGFEMACILSRENKTSCIGSTKGLNFLLSSPELISQFSSHLENKDLKEPYPAEKERLRKEVQNLFNYKYSLLLGKESVVPYSKYKETYIVKMPENMKFCAPSNYGKTDKIKILEKPEEVVFKFISNNNSEEKTNDQETSALDSETNALDSETNALDSETNAFDSETNALDVKKQSAVSEETSALDSETNALDSETNPLDSETNPFDSETNALDVKKQSAVTEDTELLLKMVYGTVNNDDTELLLKMVYGTVNNDGIGKVVDSVRYKNRQKKLLREKKRLYLNL